MKVQVVLCSENHYFLECFSSYIIGKKEVEFDISFYSDFDSVSQHVNEKEIEVFIADEQLLKEIEIPKDIVGIAISDRTKVNFEGDYSELNIYQRGVDILSDIQKILSTLRGKGITETEKGQKVISFSSIQGGAGKTTLAYLCAMLCAKEKRSMYCNLEEFAYTDHLYQMQFDTKMEEIMFALKDKRDISTSIINIMKRNKDNVLVIPTIENFGDLQSMTEEDTIAFIQALKNNNDVEYIFLDVPNGFGKQNEKIFELCDYNFFVFADDAVGRGKLEHLKNDQSMQEKKYYQELFFIINKSRKKNQDKKCFSIPFSESLFQGVDLEQVVSGKQDFYTSCKEILQFIGVK